MCREPELIHVGEGIHTNAGTNADTNAGTFGTGCNVSGLQSF